MPVLADTLNGKTTRKQSRLWIAPALFLALLLLLPLVPLIRPVKVRVGGTMVLSGLANLTGTDPGQPAHGFSAYSLNPGTSTTDQEGVDYLTRGRLNFRTFRVWNWVYYLVWFRGERLKG